MNNQKLFSGEKTLSRVKEIIESEGAQKILCITGKTSFIKSGAKAVFEEEGLLDSVKIYDEFETNPKYKDVLKGIALFREFQPEILIAIGGGTSIDMAKLINSFAGIEEEDLTGYVTGKKKFDHTAVPLVAVPTTSGSGSEATHFAVVYLNGRKYSVAYPELVPDYCILDPQLTLNLPGYITAFTGMDALCQGIESFWSINSTEESREYAEKAITLAIENIAKSVNSPDIQSRTNMQLAAYYAGKAINISKTTAAHALSYFLTSKCGIPHGHAVGIILCSFLEFNADYTGKNLNESRGQEYYSTAISKLLGLLNAGTGKEASDNIKEILNTINLETDFYQLCDGNLNFEEFVSSVNSQRLKNNPIQVSKEDIQALFQRR